MGCCVSTPNGAREETPKQKVVEVETLKIGKEEARRREQHWKVTGIVGLRSSNLKALPKSVWEIAASVRTLDASDNKISRLPPTIGSLTQLTRLVLQQNQLYLLPPEIGCLAQLRVLQVDRNELAALPDEVGGLSKLEKLTAAGNKLATLPLTIGKLMSLTELDVSKNQLTSLPTTINGCTSLRELRAAENELSSLPDDLSDVHELRTLELTDNPLAKLPLNLLRGCTQLRTLTLHKTSIQLEYLEQLDGYAAFEERRRGKYSKQLAGNALGSRNGFDQGVD